jgi:hypothetical protein
MNETDRTASSTYRENMVIVAAMEAICGQLTTAVKALSLDFKSDHVVAHFLLRHESAADREEIEDEFPSEFEALTNGYPDTHGTVIRPVIQLADDRPEGYLPPGRQVFAFRDPSE